MIAVSSSLRTLLTLVTSSWDLDIAFIWAIRTWASEVSVPNALAPRIDFSAVSTNSSISAGVGAFSGTLISCGLSDLGEVKMFSSVLPSAISSVISSRVLVKVELTVSTKSSASTGFIEVRWKFLRVSSASRTT